MQPITMLGSPHNAMHSPSTLVIVSGASKRGSGYFSSFKDGFDMRSIRAFPQFLLDPYYEPLLCFMITPK